VDEVRRFVEAITAHQDAVAIFRETGDRHGEGLALTGLGLAVCQVRRFEEAISALQEAAAIFRESNDRPRENMTLRILEAVRAAQQPRRRRLLAENAAPVYALRIDGGFVF
jgi:Tetratricopeptide repeat